MLELLIDAQGNIFAIKDDSTDPQSTLTPICQLGNITDANKLTNIATALRSSTRAIPYNLSGFYLEETALKLN